MILEAISKFFLGKVFATIIKVCLVIVIIAFIALEVIFGFVYKDVTFSDLPEKLKWLLFWKWFLS